VLQNLENALPAQQFAGPKDSGGYWNDGCLLLSPGFGCHSSSGDSVFDNDDPSDTCVTNRRFRKCTRNVLPLLLIYGYVNRFLMIAGSMYALWTVNAHNLILTGDFAQLNDLTMATWTNDIAVGINQDLLGVPARRIDNVSALGPGTILPTASDEDAQLGVGTSKNVALVTVGECGGEPRDQKWAVTPAGFLSNAATQTCINVIGDNWGHCTELIFGPCTAATGPYNASAKCTEHSVKWLPVNATGQLVSTDDGSCATQVRKTPILPRS
jgi:hypothetical protein